MEKIYALPAAPSFMLNAGFILLSIALVVGLGYLTRSFKIGLGAAIWLVGTGLIGTSGMLSDFSKLPPRLLLLILPVFIVTVLISRSEFGKRLAGLSLTVLIGYQAFRIFVELLIHQAVVEGIAPPQMTWTGMNFDIITGISALLLAPFATKLPKWVVVVWNGLGLGLLAWVVGVAILSMPTPLQQIEPDNVWVAYFPFIWLPAIMVQSALLGHLVLFRKLSGSNNL